MCCVSVSMYAHECVHFHISVCAHMCLGVHRRVRVHVHTCAHRCAEGRDDEACLEGREEPASLSGSWNPRDLRRESPTPCVHPPGQKRRLEDWDRGRPVLGTWLGSRGKFWGSSPLVTARNRLRGGRVRGRGRGWGAGFVPHNSRGRHPPLVCERLCGSLGLVDGEPSSQLWHRVLAVRSEALEMLACLPAARPVLTHGRHPTPGRVRTHPSSAHRPRARAGVDGTQALLSGSSWSSEKSPRIPRWPHAPGLAVGTSAAPSPRPSGRASQEGALRRGGRRARAGARD